MSAFVYQDTVYIDVCAPNNENATGTQTILGRYISIWILSVQNGWFLYNSIVHTYYEGSIGEYIVVVYTVVDWWEVTCGCEAVQACLYYVHTLVYSHECLCAMYIKIYSFMNVHLHRTYIYIYSCTYTFMNKYICLYMELTRLYHVQTDVYRFALFCPGGKDSRWTWSRRMLPERDIVIWLWQGRASLPCSHAYGKPQWLHSLRAEHSGTVTGNDHDGNSSCLFCVY